MFDFLLGTNISGLFSVENRKCRALIPTQHVEDVINVVHEAFSYTKGDPNINISTHSFEKVELTNKDANDISVYFI